MAAAVRLDSNSLRSRPAIVEKIFQIKAARYVVEFALPELPRSCAHADLSFACTGTRQLTASGTRSMTISSRRGAVSFRPPTSSGTRSSASFACGKGRPATQRHLLLLAA